MYCGNCGKIIKINQKFCGNCGENLIKLDKNSESSKREITPIKEKDIAIPREISQKKLASQFSKKEIFITALKVAKIKGFIKDFSNIDRQKSGKVGTSILLCNSQGKVISNISIDSIEKLINQTEENQKYLKWENELLEVWDKKPSSNNKSIKKQSKNIFGFLYKIIIGLLTFAFIVFMKTAPRALKMLHKNNNQPPSYTNPY